MVTSEIGTGNNTVDMGMVRQRLPPGVQNYDDAGLSTEIALVLRKIQQRLRSSVEQE